MEVVKYKVPAISELFSGDMQTAFKNEELNLLLNQEPKKEWIKEHPFIKGYRYLPIDKIEFMLRKIFKRYRIEVIKTGIIFNAVEVTVRVWYWNPVSETMEYHDGVGAQELQTKKDTGTLKPDFSNVNNGAVTMALPIAKTVAIKDACDHFGKLFGCDLNRKDTISFQFDADLKKQGEGTEPEIQEQLDLITDLDGLDRYVTGLVLSDGKLNKDINFRNAVEQTRKRLTPKN